MRALTIRFTSGNGGGAASGNLIVPFEVPYPLISAA